MIREGKTYALILDKKEEIRFVEDILRKNYHVTDMDKAVKFFMPRKNDNKFIYIFHSRFKSIMKYVVRDANSAIRVEENEKVIEMHAKAFWSF